MRLYWFWLLMVVLISGAADAQKSDDAQWLRQSDPDRQAIAELCRQARQDWLDRRLAHPESKVWKDHFVLYGTKPQTGRPDIVAWQELVENSKNLVEVIGEITPHPGTPHFEVQGPVAVIRLPLARCRSGANTYLVDNLVIATRRDGKWQGAAAVVGDWKLTEADRFDPQNEDHKKLQAFYDRVNQVIVAEDPAALRDVAHPLFRLIWPGLQTARLENAVLGDREGVVSSFQDLWQQSDIQKHHHKIFFAKVMGPLALTLAECAEVKDNGPETKQKCLQFFCRDGDQWKSCLWTPGDWEKVFRGE